MPEVNGNNNLSLIFGESVVGNQEADGPDPIRTDGKDKREDLIKLSKQIASNS